MKFLITGGLGFVGANLGAHLIEQNAEPIVFDNMTRVGCEANYKWLQKLGKLFLVKGDIRSKEDVAKLIQDLKPEVIFHLAGQVALTTSIENPRVDFEVNSLGTLNLLEAVRLYSHKSIIFYSSTNKVYGDLNHIPCEELPLRYSALNHPNGFDENLGLDFSGPYGCSKGSADQYMLNYSRIYGLQTVVFRHSTIFGYRQFSTIDQGWVGWFLCEALKRQKGNLKTPISIAGNGKQVRDIMFSSDLVNCYFSALKNISVTSGRVYNIGGGRENSLSILELIQGLKAELGCDLPLQHNTPRPFDQKFFVANTAAAERDFGWSPKVRNSAGIKSMLDWLRNNPIG